MTLSHPRTKSWKAGLCSLMLLASLSGCGTVVPAENRVTAGAMKDTAAHYWPYAALAADVYDAVGRPYNQLALVRSSPWLLREVEEAKSKGTSTVFDDLTHTQAEDFTRRNANLRCERFRKLLAAAARVPQVGGDADCDHSDNPLGLDTADAQDPENALRNQLPARPEDCEFDGKRPPAVPVMEAVTQEGWEVAPDLERRAHPRGWSVFVPGLAIDVWRRRLSPLGEVPEVEYAVVYRGTVGGGGWFSNFRALTAFTPLIWDQYRQALRATDDLIKQIYLLHRVSDELFHRPNDATRIRITAVGHSLGGGLASYVYLRLPEITSVVAFDPSPVNGSSMFSPEPVSDAQRREGKRDRVSVAQLREAAAVGDTGRAQAEISVLYEEGEVLSSLAGCTNGPIWGAEGGPSVRCDSVNFSGGSAFRQHSMSQLACKLYLAKMGLPTRRSPS
jgi:hypothetical protein